jgi:hypothetical protein
MQPSEQTYAGAVDESNQAIEQFESLSDEELNVLVAGCRSVGGTLSDE